MRSRTLLGALLATAALLAACSSDGPPPPLQTGGFAADGGGICAPGALGQKITDGYVLLYNSSTSPVTVTSVKLPPSSRGLAISKAWLTPQWKSPSGSLNYAGDPDYPPITWGAWPQRQQIPGAVIRPHQTLNLIFGAWRTAPRIGRTVGPVITYTSSGDTYALQEHFGFVLVAPHTRCPKAD
jgi:hypothetical protein